MKIKKEALTVIAAKCSESDNLTNGSENKSEHVCSTILSNSCDTDSPISINISEENRNTNTSQNASESDLVDGATETWQQTRIFSQALLSMTSGQIEKADANVDDESVLPKLCGSLQSVDGIKLTLPAASETSVNNTISPRSFSSGAAFSTLTQLPPASLPFVSLPFGTVPATLNSSCSESTHVSNTMPITPLVQTCNLSSQLENSSVSTRTASSNVSHSSLNSLGEVMPENISSAVAPVVSSYPITSAHLCRAVASLSTKDESVTVVYSSVPKMEPCSRLIHSIQKTVPLPSISEVKSSLTNHLNVLPQTQSKVSDSEGELHKIPIAVSGISTANGNSHSTTLGFSNLSSVEVSNSISTIKLDESSNSSEFGNDPSIVLSSRSVKFGSDNSDMASSIVIPVSSDVILTKLDGQSTTSQDISHIITIPLPAGTIYNSSLSIPISSLSLCNGGTPGTSVQMAPTVVPNLPYSHQNTSVTTSLPVSIMSVASATSSVPVSNMVHSLSNTVSVSTQSQVTNAISTVAHDPVCYTVQSPAEILNQLSKAGVLPTMSSSQVSSVLSALGSDSHVDLETDNAHQSEMLNNHVLQNDKVSTLTQTDALEMNMIPQDEKIIQLLSSSQLLDNQVNGSHMMITSTTNQSQSLNPETTHITSDLNNDEHVSSKITEIKQSVSPFPKIVAMVLNAPISDEKLSVSDVDVMRDTVFKNSQIKVSNTVLGSAVEHNSENPNSSIHDFLVLPSSTKPQRKRTNRTSALREMLLGTSEISEKDVEVKKPRGRPKKAKNDSVACTKTVSVKNNKKISETNECDWNSVNKDLCFTKEVSCFKCKFCPFLSLEYGRMMAHVREKHTSEVSEESTVRQELKCPGCPNVFFTTDSLEVHLKQDHQVNTPELKAITNTVIKIATENGIKQVQQVVKKKKFEKRVTNNGEIKETHDVNVLNVQTICDIPEVLVGSSNNNIPMLSVSGALIMSTNNDGEVLVNEENKIRVRNLNNGNTETENNFKDDDNVKDNKINTVNINVVQERINDVSRLCDPMQSMESSSSTVLKKCIDEKSGEPGVQTKSSMEEQKKKRGRPRGSRSSLLFTGLRINTEKDNDRSSKKVNVGHRCNIDNCAVTMRSPENIEYHRSCHNGLEFRCPECTHTHCHWNGMSIHLWRVHMMDMELYTCDQCNYKTNSYAKLINLHKWIHGSERPFLCDSCGKGFKNRKQLRNHKAIHQPKQTKVGECEICGRAFTNKRMLRMHLDNVHNKLRPHLCNYCGYSASSVSSLKMHMRKHTGEKPFRCHVCDYCTADHNSLRRHKMRHTGDKPYKCPHCPYACIQSSTYKAHLKTKHPGMDGGLMFSCNLCSFRSVKEENYMSHLSEHKREAVLTSDKQANNKLNAVNSENSADKKNIMPVIINIASRMPSCTDTMPLESDFEAEEITGDISDAELITGDINDSQEYKVCEADLKIGHQEENHSAIL